MSSTAPLRRPTNTATTGSRNSGGHSPLPSAAAASTRARRRRARQDAAQPRSSAGLHPLAPGAAESQTSPPSRRPRVEQSHRATSVAGVAVDAIRSLIDGAYLPSDVAVSFDTSFGDTFAATLDILRRGPFPDGAITVASGGPSNRLLELATASLRAAYPPPLHLLRTARQHLRRCIDDETATYDTGGIAVEDAAALMAFFDKLPRASTTSEAVAPTPAPRRRRRSVTNDGDEPGQAAATNTPTHDPTVLLAAASPSAREGVGHASESLPPEGEAALHKTPNVEPASLEPATSAAVVLAPVRFPADVNPTMARYVFAALSGGPVVEELDATTDAAHRVLTVASVGHEAVLSKRPPVTAANLRDRPLAVRHGRVAFLMTLDALGFPPRMQLAMLYGSPCPEARGELTYGLVTDTGAPANRGVVGGGSPAVVPPPGHFGVPAFSVPPLGGTPAANNGGGFISSDTMTAVFGPFVRGGVHAWTITGEHVEYLAIGVVSTEFRPTEHKDFTKVAGCANLFMSGELHSNFGATHASQRTDALFGSKCAIVLTIHYGHMLVTWSQAHDGTVLAITPFDGRELAPAVTLRYQSTVRWAYTPWLAAPISTPAVVVPPHESRSSAAGAHEATNNGRHRRGRRGGPPPPPPGAPGQPNPQPGEMANAGPPAMLPLFAQGPFGAFGVPFEPPVDDGGDG